MAREETEGTPAEEQAAAASEEDATAPEADDAEPSAEAEEGEGAEAVAPLPGAGTDAGETLQKAHDAFERGDFAAVRRLADGLAGADDPEVARAAVALRRRTEADPVQVGVLVACLLFFLFVAWKYVLS